MADNRFSIVVDAKTGAAQAELKRLGEQAATSFDRARVAATKFETSLSNTWRGAKRAWVEIAAGAVALNTAWNLANKAAAFAEREQAFANLAASHGRDAKKIIDDMKAMSGQTVDTMKIMESAGAAIAMGVPAENLAKLMEIARASAKVRGRPVAEMFDDLALALARVSPKILDNLNIIVSLEKANKDYAKAMNIVGRELTDQEKKQAFVNAAVEKGQEQIDRVAARTESQAERLQRYQARWRDAMVEVGKVVLTIAQGMELVLTAAGATINRLVSKGAAALAWYYEMWDKVPGIDVTQKARELRWLEQQTAGAADIGIEHMSETWDLLLGTWKEAEPIVSKITPRIAEQGAAAENAGKKLDKYVSDFERYVDAAIKAETEKANRIGELFMVTKKAEEEELKRRREALKLQKEERYAAMGGGAEDFWMAQARERWEVHSRGLDAVAEVEEAAGRRMVALSERTAEDMERNFSDLYFDAITGKFKRLEDYVQGVLESIARATSDVLGQMTKELLFGENESGGGGFLSGALGFVGSLFGGGASAAPAHVGAGATTAFGMAKGGALPGISAYENRVVTQPTVFPFAAGGRFGLMGEAGWEAVMPLTRTRSGNLGVEATVAPVNVTVHNYAGADVAVSRDGADVDVIIRRAVAAVAADMQSGGVTAAAAVRASVRDLKARGSLRETMQAVM